MKKIVSLLTLSVLSVSLPSLACDLHEHAGKAKLSASKTANKSIVKINTKSTFNVEGMTCDSCANKVNKAISSVKGVKSVNVSLDDEKATVVLDPKANAKLVSEAISKAVAKSGYKATKI